ncbi:M24 family metallopeptidase [Treponema zioleckii]|uniref:M24 family metallopeptidase n=1 Tax=Treponema zioleckii TaxID=331680 RepID=UPI0018D98D9E|nr:Xaa-Pro peptidase family protein [Treponema zioleckii]
MEAMYAKRFENVRSEMNKRKIDALVVTDPFSIWYLSGIWNDPHERMYVLLIEKKSVEFFVNKLFNIPKNEFNEHWFSDTDDYVAMLSEELGKSDACTVGIDKTWSARFLIPLTEKCPKLKFVLGSDCVDNSRACKDDQEIAFMKEASRINDICIQRGIDFVRSGMTEKKVADYIDAQFKIEGAESPSFETIVSFGANAADPHHSPDETVVKEGDCVLIDMGCKKNRYCSDMTRTVFFKKAPEEYTKIHDLVRTANERAESLIKPGIPICEIDKAARDVISEAGYGEFFTHRLGHFIGQTDHEQGDVSSANKNLTKEGMIFSVEPGVYLPGKFGVRIEDLVLVTKDGCEVLNHVDKHWKVIG